MRALGNPLVALAMLSIIGTTVGSETRDAKTLEEIASYRQWTSASLMVAVPVDFSSLAG